MMPWLRRALGFAAFSLAGYWRSGRIVGELTAIVVIVWVAFWPRGNTGLDRGQLMSIGGIFMLGLALYTTSAFAALANRASGYVFLARPLGRSGYLVGMLLAASVVLATSYLLLVALVVGLFLAAGRAVPADFAGWGLASLAVLLDVGIVSLYALLLAPLIVHRWQRLVALGFVALGLGSYIDSAGTLGPIGAAAGALLLPAVSALGLAAQPRFGPDAAAIVVGQIVEAAVLLALVLALFRRRDVIFQQ
jgi:hypothetical protein